MKIYKGFEEAKNGKRIPVFLSGRTMESRYNPDRDAQNLCDSIEEGYSFFLVLGIGSGLFIKLLAKRFPEAKIIGLELYQEDLDFLCRQQEIQELENNYKDKLRFVSLDKLEALLCESYIPAKYGNLKIIEQRAWINENKDSLNQINAVLQKALGIISADFSVQAHFGKLWTTNIMNNAGLAEKLSVVSKYSISTSDLKKTAVIVAAGSSLDKTVELIKVKNSYYIIATDTAGLSLINKGIIPDIIISIDGQSVSYNHFMKACKAEEKKPLYAFDFCSNFSAVKHLAEAGANITFFCSGHPLSSAINLSAGSPFPLLFSGAGTVTITALDFALQAGFQKLMILGADFAYQEGKAYTSGTYLDTLYNKASSKLSETEQTFAKLMYRTELIDLSDKIKTTQILQAYKTSLEKYLTDKNISFSKKDQIYRLECKDSQKSEYFSKVERDGQSTSTSFSLTPFMERLKSSSPEEAEQLLLPYIAWLRNRDQYKNMQFKELVKLALDSIVRYNI